MATAIWSTREDTLQLLLQQEQLRNGIAAELRLLQLEVATGVLRYVRHTWKNLDVYFQMQYLGTLDTNFSLNCCVFFY